MFYFSHLLSQIGFVNIIFTSNMSFYFSCIPSALHFSDFIVFLFFFPGKAGVMIRITEIQKPKNVIMRTNVECTCILIG